MSIIERALERLKQSPAPRPADVPAQAERTSEPRGENRRPTEASVLPFGETARFMPCRADRTVAIDLQSLRDAGMVPPGEEDRRFTEEFRTIKRALLKPTMSGGGPRNSNVIIVTSALPGEGKTFVTINLARGLALERDREVVLVDGDVAKRHVTRLFMLDREPGLLDAVSGDDCGLADVVCSTDQRSMYVLPAGTGHAEATEDLGSERMSTLVDALAADPRRLVIIDAPPLLLSSEAGALLPLAGQVLVVVKCSGTPQSAVIDALSQVPEDKVVRMVLNQADSASGRGYGHYGYYGHYGQYGQQSSGGDAPAAERATGGAP